MRLTVFRHGIAIDRSDPDCPADPERALTSQGIKRTRDAARGLRRIGVQADLIVSSPYVRATQTARLAAKAMGLKKKSLLISEALLPGADPAVFLAELAELKAKEVLCVGHAPHLNLLVAEAIGAPVVLPIDLGKAGAAQIVWDGDPLAGGLLRWVMAPKALRQLAGSRCGSCPKL